MRPLCRFKKPRRKDVVGKQGARILLSNPQLCRICNYTEYTHNIVLTAMLLHVCVMITVISYRNVSGLISIYKILFQSYKIIYTQNWIRLELQIFQKSFKLIHFRKYSELQEQIEITCEKNALRKNTPETLTTSYQEEIIWAIR